MFDDSDVVAIGNYGRATAVSPVVREVLRRECSSDREIIMTMKCGRAIGFGVPFSRMNWSPYFCITSTSWFLLGRRDGEVLARGALAELLWAQRKSADSVVVMLAGGRRLRFIVGGLAIDPSRTAILEGVARANLASANFNNIAPQQRAVAFEALHYGGYGAPLPADEESVISLTGAGVSVLSATARWMRPSSEIRGIQIGGVGEYTTGGGWFGGGLGVSGALEGAAFAAIMNILTTRRHVDTLIRIIFDDAEVTFGTEKYTPARLEVALSALLAAVRMRGSHQSATLQDASTGQGTRFCTGCGTPRVAGAAFCGGCGQRLP
ncbi:zinc ribbon domain-containing protein [Parafrankia sp. FMc6]|uniref:hypothetical protein n=1 Tax=Parafrankia soli TaxID=2599596 RepID=UPI0034D559D8